MVQNRKDRERALRAIASPQGGYFTARQALGAGYGYRLQHFHRQLGNWQQVDRAVYRFPDFPDSTHEDLIRWALWSSDRSGRVRAVASHETALSVHELGDVMPSTVHLTVPRSFRKASPGGCILHRAELAEPDIEARPGFLVTTPRRTLIDAAESPLSPEHLAGSVRDALRRGLVQRRQLLDDSLPPKARARLIEALREAVEAP